MINHIFIIAIVINRQMKCILHNTLRDVVGLRVLLAVLQDGQERVERLVGNLGHFVVVAPPQRGRVTSISSGFHVEAGQLLR